MTKMSLTAIIKLVLLCILFFHGASHSQQVIVRQSQPCLKILTTPVTVHQLNLVEIKLARQGKLISGPHFIETVSDGKIIYRVETKYTFEFINSCFDITMLSMQSHHFVMLQSSTHNHTSLQDFIALFGLLSRPLLMLQNPHSEDSEDMNVELS